MTALKCYVTEHEVSFEDERGMPVIDNGTSWKWWPMDKFHKNKESQLVECDDSWLVCRSRQPIHPTTPFDFDSWVEWNPFGPRTTANPNRTTELTTTTTPVPSKCIACGKSTWRRVGVGMETGEEFVSLGCYGSDMAKEVNQMSCHYNPSGNPGCHKLPFSPSPDAGGDLCSQCFCDNDDGCNGSPKMSVKKQTMIGILIIGWFYGLI